MSRAFRPEMDIWSKVIVTAMLGMILSAMGCCGSGAIKASEVDGTMRRIMDRHDDYTKNDKGLSDVQRRMNLRDSAIIREVLDSAVAQVTTDSK